MMTYFDLESGQVLLLIDLVERMPGEGKLVSNGEQIMMHH